MYDTFAADLEKANGEESKFQKAFEDHIAVLEKSTSDLKREIVSKQEESAAKAQALSEAEATLSPWRRVLKVPPGACLHGWLALARAR